MKYKCYECGCVFDEDEAGTYRECVGEFWFWGDPAYEEWMICPHCGSDNFEEIDDEEGDEDE